MPNELWEVQESSEDQQCLCMQVFLPIKLACQSMQYRSYERKRKESIMEIFKRNTIPD